MPAVPVESRKYMHCGWMDSREWLDAKPGEQRMGVPSFVGADADGPGAEWKVTDKATGERFPDVCPGWAARQPLVVEACQAYKAFDKGAMGAFFPDISHALAEAVMELSRAFDEYSRQKMPKPKD